jgi:PKD repeat protein
VFPSIRTCGARLGVLAGTLGACSASLGLAGTPAAQFGTIQREQKISAVSGGFTAPLGNDYRLGVSVAELGDFDGDGIRDLAAGSHRADIGGQERGAIWLLLMNADGTVREHRQISSEVGGFTGQLEDHDRFGISLCSLGDLDLDGTTDLAVGAYRDDDGGIDFGCVYVLFLTPAGTVKSHRKISALSGGFTGVLRVEDSFGWSVENVGDLDDDGVVDLAVGATRDDGIETDGTRDFGALYFLFMNADGTVKSHSLIDTQSSVIGSVLRPRDRFGADVVLLEDADGDGVEDIAVGAFGEDPLKVGRVFVLHLCTDGSVKSYTEITAGLGGFAPPLGKGDRFGISLAADDLDGDGLHDLVIGAVGDDDGGAESGALWVCLLNASGRVRAFDKISPDFGGFGGLLHMGDNFGTSVTTLGDLDRDGAVDLAVGAYQDDDGGFDRGATWILFRAGTGSPVADFVATPNSGEAPLAVAFGDRSSGMISAWSWDFGDGTSSSEVSPEHVFTEPGVYDVTLTVQGPNGSDELLRQRAVVAQPTVVPSAAFTVSSTSGNAPFSLACGDRSTGSITSWSWDFGDGTGSSLRNPRKVYSVPGTYSVSLTVSGPAGTSNQTEVDLIHVLPPLPVADFSADPGRGFLPLSVAFTDLSSSDVTSWEWDFGDGTTASERAPVHVYTLPGLHDVTLVVRGPGGSHARVKADLVEALEPLQSVFEVAHPGGIAPVTVQFTDRSTGGATSWAWDFGDGDSSGAQSPSHVYREGGTFLVRLTVGHAGESSTATATVEIGEPPPEAGFSVSTAGGFLPLTVQFTDRSTGNVTAWQWDFGDGSGSSERHPVHVYYIPGRHTVRLQVWSAGGVDGVALQDLIHVRFVPRLFGAQLAHMAPQLNGSLRRLQGF